MKEAIGFNTEKYLESQTNHINRKIQALEGAPVFMEFGGKPFGDHHAERVLPGYEANCKARLLADLMPSSKIVMVVNAKDILLPEYGRTLKGRVRGDSQLTYDDETIRLVNHSRELGLSINNVVLAVSPNSPTDVDKRAIDSFRNELDREGIKMYQHFEVQGYPSTNVIDHAEEVFNKNDRITNGTEHLIAFSPGGGSGKFGVLLSEIYRSLQEGYNPNYIKFETFPIFTVDSHHALNLAFEAATADLQNKVISLSADPNNPITTYDKDIENYFLLKKVFGLYGRVYNPVDDMCDPTAMSVNTIMEGVTDEQVVIFACGDEIRRRVKRYEYEVDLGIEKTSTLERAKEIFDIFRARYGD